MDPLAAHVAATIRRRALLRAGDRVLVALSGGPDSVVLTHVLFELRSSLSIDVAGVAHFNHQLRPTADEDEVFCRDLAARLDVRFHVGREDVRSVAAGRHRSVEDTARDLRYGFLDRARLESGATHVAVAHTRDDQAETVLLRLVRGAGPLGLRAILPVRDRVVRPLIDVSRSAIELYQARHDLVARHDESNDDLGIARNRVRHQLLPYLRQHFSPRILEGLAQHADQAHELSLWVEQVATERASVVVLESKGRVELDVAALVREPKALRRVLLLGALRAVAGGRFVGADHVAALEAMALGQGPERMDLPGQRAWVERGKVLLEVSHPSADRRRGRGAGEAGAASSGGASVVQPVSLPVPGMAACAGGWRVEAESAVLPGGSARHKLSHGGEADFVAVIDCPEPELFVRSRRAGDVLEPIGLGGRKKLQDLFVDRKVARHQRSTWPIVVDGRDRIIWVVGLAQAADFQVRGAERGVILLKAKRLGG